MLELAGQDHWHSSGHGSMQLGRPRPGQGRQGAEGVGQPCAGAPGGMKEQGWQVGSRAPQQAAPANPPLSDSHQPSTGGRGQAGAAGCLRHQHNPRGAAERACMPQPSACTSGRVWRAQDPRELQSRPQPRAVALTVGALQLAVGGDAPVRQRHQPVRAGIAQAAKAPLAVLPKDAVGAGVGGSGFFEFSVCAAGLLGSPWYELAPKVHLALATSFNSY